MFNMTNTVSVQTRAFYDSYCTARTLHCDVTSRLNVPNVKC